MDFLHFAYGIPASRQRFMAFVSVAMGLPFPLRDNFSIQNQ
jgi:hypothetical protein